MKFSKPAALGEEFLQDTAEHPGDLEYNNFFNLYSPSIRADAQEFFGLIEGERMSELEKLIKAGT